MVVFASKAKINLIFSSNGVVQMGPEELDWWKIWGNWGKMQFSFFFRVKNKCVLLWIIMYCSSTTCPWHLTGKLFGRAEQTYSVQWEKFFLTCVLYFIEKISENFLAKKLQYFGKPSPLWCALCCVHIVRNM